MLSHKLLNEGDIQDKRRKLYRSNSCRIDNYNFPLDFVPQLRPKLHGSIPSPMNLGLKCNKNNFKLDTLKLDEVLEYNSDIEIYYNRSKNNLKFETKLLRSSQKFKTNKNLLEALKESPQGKQIFSNSPKKISIKSLKVEDFKLDDGEIEFLGNKTISNSPKKSSILNHLERKISTVEDYFFKNS